MAAAEQFVLNPYLTWQREQGIPIHTGYFVEDLRTVPVGIGKSATPTARSSTSRML